MAILRNIQNNHLYRYLGGNRYRNLMTGVEGEIGEDVAQRIFKINLELTEICENFPNVEKLIHALKLKIN
ncbi:MAG: hypothetical protein RLZZ196_2123, partial [Bacteroidota bacterium]